MTNSCHKSKEDISYSCHGDIASGTEHHQMMIADFKKRFYLALILSAPVLFLSPMIQSFFSYEFEFPGSLYVLFLLSSMVFFYGGWPFLKGLADELKEKAPGMMTLIGLAVSVAYFYSSAVVFGLPGKAFFWELVTLIDIMLLGHWIEMKSILGASKALELLVKMMPSEAHLVDGNEVKKIKIEKLKVGDLILIKPGEKVPADGIVIEGESHLNESMLTGESKPVKKITGDQVIGASLNGNGSLKLKVERTGKDSYLAQVIELVQDAQKKKSRTQRLADFAAKWLAFLALSVGTITIGVWLFAGFDFAFSLERMVTVMVISCPHALGLAIPLVVAISTTLSAQKGLLIRNRTAFENSRKISTIIFDKTGTLTKGDFGVSRFGSLCKDIKDDEVLAYAASLESQSEHPIALGVVRKSRELGLQLFNINNFSSITGKGIEAELDSKKLKVVSPAYLEEQGIEIPQQVFSGKPETIIFLLINNKLAGFIALADEIRPEANEAIAAFKRNKIKVVMATGDNYEVAKSVSEELGLDSFHSEVLPHEKLRIIERLQEEGEFVAMTGDGVNDAPALAQADIGIAVGSGTDIAAETADIILVNSNPQDILSLILFGKATYRKMVQNLIWATAYNLISLPLAAGILYPVGFLMSPAVGAILMSLSTIIVALNAQLLRFEVKK